MRFFDAHTHIHFAAYANDFRDVIDRALKKEVGMVLVGTQRDTSRAGVELAREYSEGVYAAVGLHPIHTGKSWHDPEELGGGENAKGFTSRGEDFDYDYYKALALDPRVVAIGECGLDYFRIEGDRKEHIKKQKMTFESQIALSAEIKKPLMIHCRNAFADLTEILRTTHYALRTSDPGLIHFMTGTPEDARALLDLGFSFAFGGVVTFTRDYDPVIREIPLDRILTETDAPYVAPAPYRGRRNEPAYIEETVKKLAELKGISVDDMAAASVANARRVFGI